MKKITLTLIFLFVAFLAEAQIHSQNFNTALGWTTPLTTTWTRVTSGGTPTCSPFEGTGMAKFDSYNLANNTTAILSSPAINFTGATYRVKFKMYRDPAGPELDKIDVYIHTAAGAGGTLLGTVNRLTTAAPVVPAEGWYSYSFDIAGALTGTRYINIRGTSKYGYNIFIDDINVDQITPIDASLETFVINSIELAGSKAITGQIKNYGSTPITSMDLKWQADSGTIYTQNITGLNIAPNATYNYNHANQWVATPGNYSLKVWVSNINGGSGDSNASNDQITKAVSVASNTTPRLPLYEKFSSSTCPPCASFNTNVFTPFYNTASNDGKYSFISYQVNWPGAGDPYFFADVNTRRIYYGISGAPTLLIDKKVSTVGSTALLQTAQNAALTVPSYFTMSATKDLVGTTMTVNVNATPYLTGTYKIHVAVVEKLTTGNVATNGETSFKHVLMKMMPDGNGTTVNFVNNTPTSTTLIADLSGLHIEEMSDLEVIAFIQNDAGKIVMQSTIATQALSTNDYSLASKIKLYPNPSNGIVKIRTESPVNVVVSDVTGKTVFTMNQVSNDSQMNLSSLEKGMYLVKVSNESAEFTQKIILN
ncbi:Por secretion system C-terminal sorting domain-containing protein [Flavobacterium swingsii]|jgi:hypothetical protein|uniref:Por secretion system C-terminal sorting domain-containing protein n=1 Tax=Flavobacterium swingsii TaxID=498292 RepID=A0A1I0ZVE3_9FLAO|nr:T9SS type A sorting domain-containing protein [Flavobacterium swingsii]SFB28258.1 Por secretion system C-terminal sorting domain-containing protein [Flavobacterium swingsii]